MYTLTGLQFDVVVKYKADIRYWSIQYWIKQSVLCIVGNIMLTSSRLWSASSHRPITELVRIWTWGQLNCELAEWLNWMCVAFIISVWIGKYAGKVTSFQKNKNRCDRWVFSKEATIPRPPYAFNKIYLFLLLSKATFALRATENRICRH